MANAFDQFDVPQNAFDQFDPPATAKPLGDDLGGGYAAMSGFNAAVPFGNRITAGMGSVMAAPFMNGESIPDIYDQMRASQNVTNSAHPGENLAGNLTGIATTLPIGMETAGSKAATQSPGLVGVINAIPKTVSEIGDFARSPVFETGGNLLTKAGNLGAQIGKSAALAAPTGFAYGYGAAPEGQQLQGGERAAGLASLVGGALPVVTPALGAVGKGTSGLWNDFQSMVGNAEGRAANSLDSDLLNNSPLPSNTAGTITVPSAQAPSVMRQSLENVLPHGQSVKNIQNSLNENMGISDGLYDAQNLLNQQKKDSGTLFQDSFSANPSISSPTIDKLLRRPAAQNALQQGVVNMQNAGRFVGNPDAELGQQARDLGMDVPGGVAPGLNMETLHYVKGALDDQIGSLLRSGEKQAAVPIIQTKNALLDEMDKLDTTGSPEDQYFGEVPGLYKQARNAYSSPSQSLEALQNGRDLFNNDPELNQQLFNGMGDTDRQFSRIGTNRAVQDIMNNSSNPVGSLSNKLQQPDFANNLKLQFPDDESFGNFVSDVNNEATQQAKFSKILDRNLDGSYSAPAETTMDNVLKNPVKFSNYMSAIQGSDPQNQEMAYDAIRSHVAGKLDDAFDDSTKQFNPSVAAKITKQYSHVIDSPAFTPEQRTFLNSLPGKDTNPIYGTMAKIGAQGVLGAGAGYELGGHSPWAAAAGAIGAPLLANMGQAGIYNTANVLRNAASDPELGQSLIQRAARPTFIGPSVNPQSLSQISAQLGNNQ